jgi:hypothetical protein
LPSLQGVVDLRREHANEARGICQKSAARIGARVLGH